MSGRRTNEREQSAPRATVMGHSRSDSWTARTDEIKEHEFLINRVEDYERSNVPARYEAVKERKEELKRELAEAKAHSAQLAVRTKSAFQDVQEIVEERNSLLNKIRNRFDSSAEQEDEDRLKVEMLDWYNALSEEKEGLEAVKELETELGKVREEYRGLVEHYSEYKKNRKRLVDLHQSLFTGPTPEYPEEDEAEKEEAEATRAEQRLNGEILKEAHAFERLKEAQSSAQQAQAILLEEAKPYGVDITEFLPGFMTESPVGSPNNSPRPFNNLILRNATAPSDYLHQQQSPTSPRRVSFSPGTQFRSSTSFASRVPFRARRTGDWRQVVSDLVRDVHRKLKYVRNAHALVGVVRESVIGDKNWTVRVTRSDRDDTANSITEGLHSLQALNDSISKEIEESIKRKDKLNTQLMAASEKVKQARKHLFMLRKDILRHEHQTLEEEGGSGTRELTDGLPDYRTAHAASLPTSPHQHGGSLQLFTSPTSDNGSHQPPPPHYDVPSSPPPQHKQIHAHMSVHTQAYAYTQRHQQHSTTHPHTAPIQPSDRMWSPPQSPTAIHAAYGHSSRGDNPFSEVMRSPTEMMSPSSVNASIAPRSRRSTSTSSSGHSSSSVEVRQGRSRNQRMSTGSSSSSIANALITPLAMASLGSPTAPMLLPSLTTSSSSSSLGLGLPTNLEVVQERRSRSRSPFRFMTRD